MAHKLRKHHFWPNSELFERKTEMELQGIS